MATTFAGALALVDSVTLPGTLFPSDNDALAHQVYRELAAVLHPDRYPVADDKARATAAMSKLTALWAARNGKVAPHRAVIGKWVIVSPLHKGGFCDLYRVSHAETKQLAVLKIARHPRDNDLVKREAENLKWIGDYGSGSGSQFHNYLPSLLDTFEALYRRTIVVSDHSHSTSLAAISRMFPTGVPFRHIVWMGNRLLSALGFLHRGLGMRHSAVLPSHILYRPDDHGMTLVDYSAASFDSPSAVSSNRVPYFVKSYEHLYPLEVLYGANKGVPRQATDLFMAFASLRSAAQSIPLEFMPLFDWCLLESWRSRPHDAWEVQDRWQTTARQVYGKPTFVPFVLPVS